MRWREIPGGKNACSLAARIMSCGVNWGNTTITSACGNKRCTSCGLSPLNRSILAIVWFVECLVHDDSQWVALWCVVRGGLALVWFWFSFGFRSSFALCCRFIVFPLILQMSLCCSPNSILVIPRIAMCCRQHGELVIWHIAWCCSKRFQTVQISWDSSDWLVSAGACATLGQCVRAIRFKVNVQVPIVYKISFWQAPMKGHHAIESGRGPRDRGWK